MIASTLRSNRSARETLNEAQDPAADLWRRKTFSAQVEDFDESSGSSSTASGPRCDDSSVVGRATRRVVRRLANCADGSARGYRTASARRGSNRNLGEGRSAGASTAPVVLL